MKAPLDGKNLKGNYRENSAHKKLDLSVNIRESKTRGPNKKLRISPQTNLVLQNAGKNSLKKANFLPPLHPNNNLSSIQNIRSKLELKSKNQRITNRNLQKHTSNLNVLEKLKDKMEIRDNRESGSRDIVKESNYSKLIEENSKKIIEFNLSNKDEVKESENLWKLLIDPCSDQNKSSINLNSSKSIDLKDQEMNKIHEISNINLGARWELIRANKQLLDFDIVYLNRNIIVYSKEKQIKYPTGLIFIKMLQKKI